MPVSELVASPRLFFESSQMKSLLAAKAPPLLYCICPVAPAAEAEAPMPRLEVATHLVEVPVVCKTMPLVPVEFAPSDKPPVMANRVAVALDRLALAALRLVVVA